MSAPSRLAPRVCRFCRASPALRRTFASTATATTTSAESKQQPAWPQRQPRGEYYDMLLRDPTPYASTKVEKPPSSAHAKQPPPPQSPPATEAEKPSGERSSSDPAKTYETLSSRTAYSDSNERTTTTTDTTTAEERARVIFGSRLLGPAERADRAAGRQALSTTIAGVLVPPRPEEPDNCCMSGCVNCVWDLYREEMEEWTLKANEAKQRLAESAAAAGVTASPAAAGAGPGGGGVGGGVGGGSVVDMPLSSASMDADGGGSETNWSSGGGGSIGGNTIAKDMWTEDVFQNVPVGIREFMKQEKRLKEKHQREGTSGG